MGWFYCRIGGVELVTQHGKIKVENTLDSRLEMMSHQVYCNPIITTPAYP